MYHRHCFNRVILAINMLLPLMALSQKTITGKVFDDSNNKPLQSAVIIPKGSASGISTDRNGNFVLKIAETAHTITVSYVGYQSRSINVDDPATNYSIGLHPSMNDLQQVTVIGSRNLSRTNVTTAVPVDVIPVAKMAKEMGQTDLNQLLTYAAPSFHVTMWVCMLILNRTLQNTVCWSLQYVLRTIPTLAVL